MGEMKGGFLFTNSITGSRKKPGRGTRTGPLRHRPRPEKAIHPAEKKTTVAGREAKVERAETLTRSVVEGKLLLRASRGWGSGSWRDKENNVARI